MVARPLPGMSEANATFMEMAVKCPPVMREWGEGVKATVERWVGPSGPPGRDTADSPRIVLDTPNTSDIAGARWCPQHHRPVHPLADTNMMFVMLALGVFNGAATAQQEDIRDQNMKQESPVDITDDEAHVDNNGNVSQPSKAPAGSCRAADELTPTFPFWDAEEKGQSPPARSLVTGSVATSIIIEGLSAGTATAVRLAYLLSYMRETTGADIQGAAMFILAPAVHMDHMEKAYSFF